MSPVDQKIKQVNKLGDIIRHIDEKSEPLIADRRYILNRQKAKIETLKNEQEEMTTILKNLKEYKKNGAEEKIRKKMIDYYYKYGNTDNLQKNASEIENLNQEIDETRRIIAARENELRLRTDVLEDLIRHMKTEEERLEKQTVDFGKEKTKMEDMRATLDSLQQTIGRYETIQGHLVSKHDETRSKMNELIQSSTKANGEMVDARSKTIILREKIAQNVAQHRFQMGELERTTRQETMSEEFAAALSKERKWRMQIIALEEAEKDLECRRQRLDKLRKTFEKIREHSKEPDIKVVVEKLRKKQEESFARFRYLNEINTKIELHDKELNSLLPRIAEIGANSRVRRAELAKLNQSTKADTDAIMADTKREAESIENINKELSEFKDGMVSMLETLGCESGQLKEINDLVENEATVFKYLDTIYTVTNELVKLSYMPEMKAAIETSNFLSNCSTVVPPSIN